MSLLVPCSACGKRAKEKFAWLSWAWNLADGSRVAYKQRLCTDCFVVNAWPVLTDDSGGLITCPVCHTDPLSQLDPVYCTYIIPGMGREDAELALCAPCAVEVRARAMAGAERLENRDRGVEASASTQFSATAWEALGIRPRP